MTNTAIGVPALHPGHRSAARPADRHPSAGYTITALAWCAGIALAGYLWAITTFRKRA